VKVAQTIKIAMLSQQALIARSRDGMRARELSYDRCKVPLVTPLRSTYSDSSETPFGDLSGERHSTK
jgi:hypothetical protein